MIGEKLASPRYAFFVLFLLIVLLVRGTIAQKYMGLYHATETYFSSFVFFEGWIPFPGGYSLCLFLTVSLLCKLLFKSNWSKENSGIILIHLSILLLLFGGGLTAITQKEGFIYLQEGQEASFVSDYHNRELVIGRDNEVIEKFAHSDLGLGEIIEDEVFPFSIEITKYCENCRIIQATDTQETTIGPANFMAIEPDTLSLENEENIAGLSFIIKDQEGALLAQTTLFEGYTKPVFFEYNDIQYFFTFGREIRFIPFSVGLEKFTISKYEGTEQAREYSSSIKITDQSLAWSAEITMNEPVRYKGYTLYQASFDETSTGTATILSVVENKGRIFPYISLVICAFGLIIHLIMRRHYMRVEADL